MQLYIKKINTGLYGRIFSICVAIGVFIAFCFCWILNENTYKALSLLPVSYGLLYLLCSANRRYLKNISLSIINISAFCRYIIYPIIITITLNRGIYYEFDFRAICLLIYELIGVFVVISLFAKKLGVEEKSYNIDSSIGIGNFSVGVLFLPLIILYPSLLTKFSISSEVSKSVIVPGVIEVVFTMGIWVIFIYLLGILSLQKFGSRWQNIVCFILVIVVAVYYILFNVISGEDIKRWQIISCGIAMLYIILRLFPEKKKFVIIGGGLGIMVAVLLGSFIKFGLTFSFGNFVNKYLELSHFTEYFGGMRNVTTALDLLLEHPHAQGIESTLTDLFSGVPILSALFDYDTHATAAIFKNHVNRTDIICPLTAQSVAHFGYIGTPVLGMLMTWLAITFNSALKRTNNLYAAYVLIEIVVFTSLYIELNTTIILGRIWVRLMFLILQMFDSMIRVRFKWGRM